jgi:hypothetical protein
MNTGTEAIASHTIDPITLGVLHDEGWTVAATVPEPSSSSLLIGALVLSGLIARRHQKSRTSQ